MKKFLALLLSSAMILSLAGCNKDKNEDKTDNGTEKVTDVAFAAPDMGESTKQSIEYLKGQVPLFAEYLETRTKFPLTYEVEVPSAEGTGFAGIYIKDKDTVSIVSRDALGNSSTTIYDDDELWYIEDATKTAYVRKDFPDGAAENAVKAYLLQIDYAEAVANTYTTGEKEYDGVLYKHETITSPEGYFSEYYYDMETGDLKIISASNAVSYVTALTNKVTNEDAFKIPADYAEGDLMKYMEETQNGTITQ